MRFRFAVPVATLLALACLASAAPARQIRINLSGFAFSPSAVTLDEGDHAVWVWVSNSHTVTSGDGNSSTPDGVFGAGTPELALSPGATFSWKSDRLGAEPYFCYVHAPLMVGTLTMMASGVTANLSDFRFTEVLFSDPAGHDLVEISNLGSAGNLGMYRLKIDGVPTQTLEEATGMDLDVPGGGSVVVHLGVSGTSTATDLFLPSAPALGASGSLALYVPNTVNTSLSDATQILDFVEWGPSGQENEGTAIAANLWNGGDSVPNTVAAGHSIEFCGQGGQYGASHWAEIAVPTFGSLGTCTTPTVRTTWGRMKSLYR